MSGDGWVAGRFATSIYGCADLIEPSVTPDRIADRESRLVATRAFSGATSREWRPCRRSLT